MTGQVADGHYCLMAEGQEEPVAEVADRPTRPGEYLWVFWVTAYGRTGLTAASLDAALGACERAMGLPACERAWLA